MYLQAYLTKPKTKGSIMELLITIAYIFLVRLIFFDYKLLRYKLCWKQTPVQVVLLMLPYRGYRFPANSQIIGVS
jgi:hypothetical protein